MQEAVTALAVYNIPFSANESEVHSFFPTAKSVNILRNQSTPSRSRGMCILQFSNPRDCQQAYDECMEGKEIEGRVLRAEYSTGRRQSSSDDTGFDRNQGYNPRSDGDSHFSQASRGATQNGNGCVLTVSNLPYSASERDILREFPDALRVALTMDDQGRSKGVAQLTFSSTDQCNAALNTCNQKMLGGRQMRGKIMRDDSQGSYASGSRNNESRDYSNSRDNQREYGGPRNYGGQRDHDNQRNNNQRDFSQRSYGNQRDGGQRDYNNSRDNGNQRDFGGRGGRQYDYNSGRGGRDGNRFHGAGGQQNRQGPRDFDRNDRNDFRRDRSPVRGEPVRGYGSSKGPRITSAVIHRPGGAPNSPSSSSSSDED